jgi:hypothetical protein
MDVVKVPKLGLESIHFADTTILGLQRITHGDTKLLKPQCCLQQMIHA